MTATARALTIVALSLALTAAAPRLRPGLACDDDDCGNASAGIATKPPTDAVQAAFSERSYSPSATATLHLRGAMRPLILQIFRAGFGRDGVMQGAAISSGRRLTSPRSTVSVHLGSWHSGLYYARVTTPGHGTWDAPFVLRPVRLGTNRVAIVLPTNTWQAYNFEDGDSWYLDSSVHEIDLSRPYLDAGVPPHYHGYDRGFIRWLYLHRKQADFLSDDDLDALSSGDKLAPYRLVIFSGHEEYVTGHEFDVVQRYRNLGGNLAFLSANDFFYAVSKHGDRMDGRTRWRDQGRPEAALVGAQYVDWNHDKYPNRPFAVTNIGGAPWLFRNTGLRDGSSFGVYGIEVDAVAPSSPPHTRVLAQIPDIFGAGKTAQMTYYETRSGAKVFSAGVMNFGGSALWPQVRTMIENLWNHLNAP